MPHKRLRRYHFALAAVITNIAESSFWYSQPHYDDCAGNWASEGGSTGAPAVTAGSLSLNLLGCSSPAASRTG